MYATMRVPVERVPSVTGGSTATASQAVARAFAPGPPCMA